MAKLLILRGDVRHAEFELPAATVRVGRSPQNEIVLEDSGKGVSRTHAEIRFEGGRHVLTDNSSQNGIWVEGARVPSVVLEPGVVASVGPYRLMVEPDDTTLDASSATATTEITGRLARQTQIGVQEEPSQPEGPVTAREQTNQQSPAVAAATKVPRRRDVRAVAAIAIAALLVVLAGLAVYTLMQPQDDIANPADEWFAPASAMVNEGRCSEVIAQYLDPALARNSTDARALDLKKRCTDLSSVSVPPPPPPPHPLTPTELLLDKAEDMMTAGGGSPDSTACQAGPATAKQVLDQEPGNAHAMELTSRAGVCLQRHQLAAAEAKRKLQPAWIASVKPSEGGVPPWSNDTPQTHAVRVQEAGRQYGEAQRAASAGDFEAFERAVHGLPVGYRDVTELRTNLERSRDRIAQATAARTDAKAAEDRDELKAAEDLYRKARELDPSVSIEKNLQNVIARRLALGKKKCVQANAAFSTGLAQWKKLYSEALDQLRPGEECYQEASERAGK